MKDDRLDFLGFSEPKEVKFLNLGTTFEAEGEADEIFKCVIGLGKTIKI